MKKLLVFLISICLLLTGCQNTNTAADRAAEYIVSEYGIPQGEVPPDVIQEERMLSLEINTDVNSPEYGHVTFWENGNVKVVMSVDTGLYWDFATDLICHMDSEFEHNYWYYAEASS